MLFYTNSEMQGKARGVSTLYLFSAKHNIPSPAGQIRRERIWSHGERPKGSGQDSPETLGRVRGKFKQGKMHYFDPLILT